MLFAQELVHSTYNISTVVGWIPRGISHLHLHWHFSYSVAILLYGYFPILCLLQLFMFIEFPSFISHVFMELISSYIPTFGGYILIPAGYQAISIFINWIIWFLIVISSYIHTCIKYPSKENLYIYIIYPIFIGPLGVPAQGPAAGRCDGWGGRRRPVLGRYGCQEGWIFLRTDLAEKCLVEKWAVRKVECVDVASQSHCTVVDTCFLFPDVQRFVPILCGVFCKDSIEVNHTKWTKPDI